MIPAAVTPTRLVNGNRSVDGADDASDDAGGDANKGASGDANSHARNRPTLVDSDSAWHSLHQAASAPYRCGGRFAWHRARGKLRHDPLYRGLLQAGVLPAGATLLDIGCGVGLMASLLQACSDQQRQMSWPAAWPGRPSARSYTGIELSPQDVDLAQRALAALPLAPRLRQADMRHAALPACDVALLLDVLHYVDLAAQGQLLQRVRDALQAGAADSRRGRLVLRVADQGRQRHFRLTQWTDRLVMALRGHRVQRTWGRPLAEWTALLQDLGFSVSVVSLQQGRLFANVLLVCDLGLAQAQKAAP